jgi:3-hydroxy acid dehydrogenase / malonic semialdehyde reductase
MSKKTVIITGASSGIGKAIAIRLLENNYHVIGLARNFDKCEITSADFTPLAVDFSNIDALPPFLTELSKQNQNLSALICCAGEGRFGSLEEFSYPQIQSLMELNFLSQVFVIKAFISRLKRQGHGDIIIMGSESALVGGKQGTIYSASKFALRGMAQSLRDECSRNGVRVTVINPGMVKSPFFNTLDFEPGHHDENFIIPEDIANAVQMVLSSRKETVFDEINLSPLKKVIHHKPKQS